MLIYAIHVCGLSSYLEKKIVLYLFSNAMQLSAYDVTYRLPYIVYNIVVNYKV